MRCEDCKACYGGKPVDRCPAIKSYTRILPDAYNKQKVWKIKRTKCGHFMLSQEICGKQLGKRVRVTKKYLHGLFPTWY